MQGIPLADRKRNSDFGPLLKTAHNLADLTGPVVLKHFRKSIPIENKAGPGAYDPVTKADRAAERIISQTLKRDYPDHGLIGEEYGTRPAGGRYQWIVDPIDGTRAYIMGSPLWGTLIGLVDNGAPMLGLMDQPFTGERVWSAETASYWRLRDGAPKKLKTRSCRILDDAILTSTHPDMFVGAHQSQALLKLKSSVRMTRFGGDCYGYALLAAGFVDLIVESGLKTFDIMPLIPIIERAGGVVTTWDGKPATGGGNIIAAGDARVHEAAMRLIARI